MSENTNIATREATAAERFTDAALRQHAAAAGAVKISDYEKTLLQHVFIRVDMAIQEFNVNLERDKAKGSKKDQPPMAWKNIDLESLALKAINRVQLGIDALIPGHLYPIPYWIGKKEKYDIDLRVGYKGELYYISHAADRPIHDIRVELVHQTDEFTVYKKDSANKVEGYTFKVTQPFNRGPVVGGFAYIEYDDEKANTLVVMSLDEINKRKPEYSTFWAKWTEEMQYKTLVHAAVKKVPLDPLKINSSALAATEAEDEAVPDDTPADANGIDLVLEGNPMAPSAPEALPEPAPSVDLPRQRVGGANYAPQPTPYDTPDFLRDQQRQSAGGRKEPF